MIKKETSVHFCPGATTTEKQSAINDKIKEIEAAGGYIVGAEPIEVIQVTIIGRKFIVEYN